MKIIINQHFNFSSGNEVLETYKEFIKTDILKRFAVELYKTNLINIEEKTNFSDYGSIEKEFKLEINVINNIDYLFITKALNAISQNIVYKPDKEAINMILSILNKQNNT